MMEPRKRKPPLRVTECEPVVCRFSVHVENVTYRHTDGTKSVISMDVDCTTEGTIIAATTQTNTPFTHLGGAFWKRTFGAATDKSIRRLCRRAVLDAIAKSITL